MCVSNCVICMFLIAMRIVFSSALSIFWYLGNHSEIFVLLLGLYTLDPAMFPSIGPLGFWDGGMNDLSVCMHCCGWNLNGCACLNMFRKDILVVFLVWVVFILGVVCHAVENLTL